ncbi:MAG: globin domain-containing protein [Pseudomonadota bacterium]
MAFKETLPLFAGRRVEIVIRALQILFVRVPEVRIMFSTSNNQPEKLAAAIEAFANFADRPDRLGQMLERIAAAHVRARVSRAHLDIFAGAFMQAMEEILPAAIADGQSRREWELLMQRVTACLADRADQKYNAERLLERQSQLGYLAS